MSLKKLSPGKEEESEEESEGTATRKFRTRGMYADREAAPAKTAEEEEGEEARNSPEQTEHELKLRALLMTKMKQKGGEEDE